MNRWMWVGLLGFGLGAVGCGKSTPREPDFSHFADPSASPEPSEVVEVPPTDGPSPTPRPRATPSPDLSDAVRAPAQPDPTPATPTPTATPTATPIPAATPSTAPSSAPSRPAPADGAWVVQLGAFGSRANADRLVARMRAAGESVTLSSTATDPPTYRVRARSFADRAAAQTEAARFRSTYTDVPATVVPR